MSQVAQDLSLPLPAVSAASDPDMTVETASTVAAANGPESDAPDGETGTDESLLDYATGATAIGYYLSMALHLIAYSVAAVVFAWIGQVLNEDEVVTPIRASLQSAGAGRSVVMAITSGRHPDWPENRQ